MKRQILLWSCVVAVVAGLLAWNIRLHYQNEALLRNQDKLPMINAVDLNEAAALAGKDANGTFEVRDAVDRTNGYSTNIRLFALKKKREEIRSTSFFNEADAPILEQWVQRNGHTLWRMMIEESLDLRHQTTGADKYDAAAVSCKWTYRKKALSESSWQILENNLTVTMTMNLKQSVIDEERRWSPDMRWPLPPLKITVRFVIDGTGVRDLELLGLKSPKKDDAFNDVERMHKETLRVLRFVFSQSSKLRWVTPHWNEADKMTWEVDN